MEGNQAISATPHGAWALARGRPSANGPKPALARQRWLGASALFIGLNLALTTFPALADDDAALLATTDPSSEDPLTFEAAFASLGAPSPLVERQSGAVDLTTITPSLGPQVLRSLGTGIASYYGKRFHGRRTANGERFNMNAMTAAHKTLPFGTRVRVTNPANGRSVTVRINDRGPFIRGRTIDLSRAAASQIGMISRGHARVKLDIVAR